MGWKVFCKGMLVFQRVLVREGFPKSQGSTRELEDPLEGSRDGDPNAHLYDHGITRGHEVAWWRSKSRNVLMTTARNQLWLLATL